MPTSASPNGGGFAQGVSRVCSQSPVQTQANRLRGRHPCWAGRQLLNCRYWGLGALTVSRSYSLLLAGWLAGFTPCFILTASGIAGPYSCTYLLFVTVPTCPRCCWFLGLLTPRFRPCLLLVVSGAACPTPAPICCWRFLGQLALHLPHFAVVDFCPYLLLTVSGAACPTPASFLLLMASGAAGPYLLLTASGLQAPTPAPICCWWHVRLLGPTWSYPVCCWWLLGCRPLSLPLFAADGMLGFWDLLVPLFAADGF